MGLLADSKSRRKINKDPNNTKWSRDTTTFGQKILRAQGWQPGQYLGAKDAAHSDLHTAANSSHIRVSVKDDVKGLGFTKSREDVVTGLDVFSDLLSRLNGKSAEAIEGDRQARLVMKTNAYVEQKWGPMRFVRGGLLVGDNMEQEEPSAESSTSESEDKGEDSNEPPKKDKKNKKRKHADVDDADADADAKKEKKRRKEERRARKASEKATTISLDEGSTSEDFNKKRKDRKDKKDESGAEEVPTNGTTQSDGDESGTRKKDRKSKSKDKKRAASAEDEAADDEKKSKREKKERKKRKKLDAEAAESQAEESMQQRDGSESAPATGVSTPTEGGTGTSTPRGGRNAARSRFLAAKRQAMMDTKALNQIFMIKA
ncbi:hypothetical protein HIM_08006 [Hirsutella minnesotensis 3608]|uniref:PinX1-related protein 1 n=1 Tax=Hirsutella minnesotensis 3608 TaxID=1043627 RepID=A0A0F7ZYK8_9HYPO|nr:hypothetical protein HIM_08006 [Hirsutella minnesotensis 3608]